MDYNTYEVIVTSGQTATVYVTDRPQNDPISILLQKHDAETELDIPQGNASLSNAEFTVKYFSSFYDTNPEEQVIQPARTWVLKTDERGFCRLGEMYKISGDTFYYDELTGDITVPLGTITIQETKAPEGYLINSEIFVRQITSDGRVEGVSTYNAPIIPEQVMKGSVELYKTDVESGNVLANAVYGIYFHDGTEVGRLTTDIRGYAKSDLLPYGNYYLQETTAPNGYVLDTTQYPFTIGADGQVITINATDKNQMGQITGTKTGEVLTGSTSTVTEDGTLYTPTYQTQGIPNATYEIFAKTDIVTSAGTVKFKAGQLVDTVTTNAQGKFTSKQLYLGTYTLKEKQAPEGFVLDTTEYEVTLTYGGQNQSIVLSPITLSDERQKVIISLKKEMEQHAVYPNPEAYKDVRFGLYTANDILDVNGGIALEKDSLLEVITLDETLTGTFTTDLPIGSYYLQEIATNEAYVLDTTKYPVEFTYQGQDIAVVEITANHGQPIVNNLKKGYVELIKESNHPQDMLLQGFANKPLFGAVYGIYTTNGTELAQLITDINGYAKSDLLPFGSYYMREITAPFGYQVNSEQYPFTISENGEIIQITALDEPKIGKITPQYTDGGGNERLISTPKTGDDLHVTLIVIGFFIAATGSLAAFILLQKREQKQKDHN